MLLVPVGNHFFAEGEHWATVPDRFRRPSVEASMSILERYRDSLHDFEVHRARKEWLRVQATIERSNREPEEQLAIERAETQQIRTENERLQAKIKELMARLGETAEG